MASRAAQTGVWTSGWRFPTRTALAPTRSTSSPPPGRPALKLRSSLAAQRRKIALPAGITIDAEVDLNVVDSGYFLSARLDVSLPGVERGAAQGLIDEAHKTCPYSKATRGNMDVAIRLIE